MLSCWAVRTTTAKRWMGACFPKRCLTLVELWVSPSYCGRSRRYKLYISCVTSLCKLRCLNCCEERRLLNVTHIIRIPYQFSFKVIPCKYGISLDSSLATLTPMKVAHLFQHPATYRSMDRPSIFQSVMFHFLYNNISKILWIMGKHLVMIRKSIKPEGFCHEHYAMTSMFKIHLHKIRLSLWIWDGWNTYISMSWDVYIHLQYQLAGILVQFQAYLDPDTQISPCFATV